MVLKGYLLHYAQIANRMPHPPFMPQLCNPFLQPSVSIQVNMEEEFSLRGEGRRKNKISATQADSDVHRQNRGFCVKRMSIIIEQVCLQWCSQCEQSAEDLDTAHPPTAW